MEVIVIGIVALVGGFVFGSRLAAKEIAPALTRVANTQAIDRANFLQSLRRELANVLVWRNPQRYLQLYRNIHAEMSSLESYRPEEVRKQLMDLCKKYPNYNDFDVIGTREYVLYADGLSMMDDAELEGCYRDLVMFAGLSTLIDEAWKDAASNMFVHTTSDRELAHLTEYVQRIEDTKLRLRIERAMDDNALARKNDGGNLNSDFYTIVDLSHFAEKRYGVHLKRTNEFCIYSFFVFDDGRINHGFYRSDPNFQTELRLRTLNAVLDEMTIAR